MNTDAPAVMRRRRRVARQTREETPEPIARMGGIKPNYSDEDNSSTTIDPMNSNANPNLSINHRNIERTQKHRTASYSSGDGSRGTNSNIAYRNKILSRRDRNATASVVRSQSTPRSVPMHPTDDDQLMVVERRNSSGSNNVMTFLRQVKRSLSIPRYFVRCLWMYSIELKINFFNFVEIVVVTMPLVKHLRHAKPKTI